MVFSHSAVSTLSLTLQAILLFTVWALHPRELSLLLPVSSMSKSSAVKVALLLLILDTAKIQKLSEYAIGVQKSSLWRWITL